MTGELGDILWYLSEMATACELKLEDIASQNIEKLFSRKDRDAISGSGDNR
jgi:NTP pyrophosphatase (non-canonical NTP hydrolase)